jgi:hypothetical protein
MPLLPLQDHFHPPLSVRRHWHAFHNAWATFIASSLNALLPEGYFAEPNVQFGIEIDVATFEEPSQEIGDRPSILSFPQGEAPWQPPSPDFTLPFSTLDEQVEISIFNAEAGPVLLAAIELISPANKDRPTQRDAFVHKCMAYLQQGIGLVIVDVVTMRSANLHRELLSRLANRNGTPEAEVAGLAPLYAAAYRPVLQADRPNLAVWHEPLAVGDGLPQMPLWLPGELCLPLDLAATYDRTCREHRIISA